jgi:hypothetical protein
MPCNVRGPASRSAPARVHSVQEHHGRQRIRRVGGGDEFRHCVELGSGERIRGPSPTTRTGAGPVRTPKPNTIDAMRERIEEEPEPEEQNPPGTTSTVPSVAPDGRVFEYRTELLTTKQLADGKSLADLLNRTSLDDWDLVDVMAAGERHVVLLRKVRTEKREDRRVGFRLPGD